MTEYLQNIWAQWVNSRFDLLPNDDVDRALMWGILVTAGVLIIYMMRLKKKKSQEEARPRFIDSGDGQEGAFGGLTDALAAQIPESRKESRDFDHLLKQAGLYSRTARASIYAFRFTFLVLPIAFALVLCSLEPENSTKYLIGGGILAGTLSILPRLYVFFRRGRRLRQIRTGLADMMDMLSMCMDGGMAISPALEHVAQNLTNYPALAEELRILKRQSEVGSLQYALNNFADRIDIPQIRQVAGLLARGETLGNRLSDSLLDQADHFRSTRRQMATMHANRTPVILTIPLMFCLAPAVLILLMAPAMLTLTDFLNPREGSSLIDGNDTLSVSNIASTIDSFDQSVGR